MHEKLHDLRLLALARQVETTCERLERAFEGRLPSDRIRSKLKPLFAGGPAHERLEQEFAALDADVKASESTLAPSDLLQAILDCERLAHDFYRANLDELSNPRLVQLFHDLAAEERHHIQAVEEALDMVNRKH